MTRLYILLGRAGDIISLLPLLWADRQAGIDSGLMVAKEFAGILDGVSYLTPVIFDGEMNEIDRAVDEGSKLCADVRVAQLAGPRNEVLKLAYARIGLHEGDAQHPSFEIEAWRLAGRDGEWARQHPLVFDRRDDDRELALIEKVFVEQENPQVILVALDGQSSPFPFKKLLLKLLREEFPKCEIIDMANIKAERIYDLLGVMQWGEVKALVACDSAILHLAQACPKLPVVALIQDKPTLFFGSAWRTNHIAYIRYNDFPERFDEIAPAIAGNFGSLSRFIPTGYQRLIHVWSQYDIRPDNKERNELAQEVNRSSGFSGDLIPCPFELGATGRDSVTVFKDIYRVPYLKDVIRHGVMLANDDDVIVITRCDTCFQPSIVRQVLALKTPGYAFRQSQNGSWKVPVADMFCFTKKFIREHHLELPDLLMGVDPYWPMVLMEFLKLHGGVEIPNAIYREKGQPFQVKRSAYREQNEKLAKAFMEKHGLLKVIPRVIEQANVTLVKSDKLFPYAYNPSLLRHNGKLLMAYRAHENMDKASSLAIAELDADLNVVSNQWFHKANTISSQEDARLFTLNGNLWFSHVESDIRRQTCVMWYGKLGSSYEPMSGFKPVFGSNNGSGLEKNWVFFDCKGSPHAIYSPEQLVIELSDGSVIHENIATAPTWSYGEIRGGCLIPWKGKLLRFFHSRLENEVDSVYWRYYVGCLVMQDRVPFAVEKVCTAPILKGSELDSLTQDERAQCSHWKPNVAIPYGVVADGDGWLLSVGINDSACGIVRLSEKDLNL